MSCVYNVMVHIGNLEDAEALGIEENQPWHDTFEEPQSLRCITGRPAAECWGGRKYPEWRIYGAAFNYLHWEKFKGWLEARPFVDPGSVMVVLKGEGDDRPAIWVIEDGRLVEKVRAG